MSSSASLDALIDAQRTPALARWLTEQGHEAEQVGGCGLGGASDAAIWRYADRTGATIVTKDQDFPRRKVLRPGGPNVVWVRLRNTRRREFLLWFESVYPEVLLALQRGESLVEIVREPPI